MLQNLLPWSYYPLIRPPCSSHSAVLLTYPGWPLHNPCTGFGLKLTPPLVFFLLYFYPNTPRMIHRTSKGKRVSQQSRRSPRVEALETETQKTWAPALTWNIWRQQVVSHFCTRDSWRIRLEGTHVEGFLKHLLELAILLSEH